MIEPIVRRFLDSRSRRWAIVIAILIIGLTTVLPAADELSRSRNDRARLEKVAARMRRDVADLDNVRKTATEKHERLAELEALAIGADQVPMFRQEIVDWVRDAGCQVRRIRLDSPRLTRWHKTGDLLEPTSAGRDDIDSAYVLETQHLSVSVSGTLSQVKSMLTRLHETQRFLQCRSLSLVPSSENHKEVTLNVDLILFNLANAEGPQA